MNGATTSIDDALKAAQLENVRLDSQVKALDKKLKNLELEHRPGFWKGVLASPAFLAALIAVLATAGSATVTLFVASQQQESDKKRSELQIAAEKEKNIANLSLERTKYQLSLLAGIALPSKSNDSCSTADQLFVYTRAKIFTDGNLRQEVEDMQKYYLEQCKILRGR